MFGLSLGHLIILAFIILLFGGAKKLPELGSALGKGVGAFKKGLEGKNQDDDDQNKKIP
jgi:sec-independent protein translocase protein TatA